MTGSIASGLLSPLINLLGGGNQTPTDVGTTPEQDLLAQYQSNQNLFGNLFPFGQTNTVMSTGATMRAGGANLGGAMSQASMADINAQNALAAQSSGSSLQQLIASNQRFDQGAQSTSGNTTSTTGNTPAA